MAEIRFEAVPPVPESLRLTVPRTLLTGVGEAVQLAATATYPGGATADVTVTGTSYQSSNPAVAAVDASGLVSARASGSVLVSALHEGALGVVEIDVVAAVDSDGDGLSDEFEVANGMDPNNPADALDDADGDGLSTVEEVQLGLDPFDPDTDGDGLLDGEEVNATGTNPRLFDTDGDGLSDGLEVRTGSDPLDPLSFNLAAALVRLEVAPASLTIPFNTVFSEASGQLRVSGTLLDGTVLDVTARRYGTIYSSSDLAVASFGAEDGRVFAGQEGEAAVTAAVGAFAATAAVRVVAFRPAPLASIEIPGFANAVAVVHGYAFVAAGAAGLVVVDVSDPEFPVLAATMDTPGNANDVRVAGDLAFVADGVTGVLVVDVSVPASPRLVSHTRVDGVATGLAVEGEFVYVADELGLSIVNVSDPAAPLLWSALTTPGRARGVDVSRGLAVVADSRGGVHVVDVSDPSFPAIVGSTATRADGTSRVADVALRDGRVYVADGAESALGGLVTVDLSDPAAPVVVGSSSGFFGSTGVALERGFAFTSEFPLGNEVPVFALDGPAPLFRERLDFGAAGFRDDMGNGIAVAEGLVYVAATGCCVPRDNGVSAARSALYIGRYAVFDDADDTPPTVELTAPAAGATARARTAVTARAAARDDVFVESVDFLVDGQVVGTDYRAPFEQRVLVPAGAAQLVLGAVARDLAGNEAAAEPVVLLVEANQAPVVELVAPVPGQSVTAGSRLALVAAASDDVAVARVEFYVDGILRASDTTAPYRHEHLVPQGSAELVVGAIAYDDAGPSEAAGPVTVAVVSDQPPLAALLAPADGSQVVTGAPVEIVVAASDDLGVRSVRLFVNGALLVTLGAEPFRWTVSAPEPGETLRIAAEVEDTALHVVPTAEAVVAVVADPLTTVAGRVLALDGTPVQGAAVTCSGFSGVTDLAGAFSIPEVATAPGSIRCETSFVTAGELRTARSRAVEPVGGGVTEVGDLVPYADLLYAAFGSGSFEHQGELALVSPTTAEGERLGQPFVLDGLTGLAFDAGGGRLLAVTVPLSGEGESRLLELDPFYVTVLADHGAVTEAGTGVAMSIGDLTLEPATGALFGLRSAADGLGREGELVRIERETAEATTVGDTGTDGAGGLAFTPDGSLYATAAAGGTVRLLRLDPADASTTAAKTLAGTFGAYQGLAARPSDGLLFGALRDFSGIMTIDPETGAEAEVGFMQLGEADDLAFRPSPPPDELTTVVGRLVSPEGDPVPDLAVSVRQVFASRTLADGRFVISGVPVGFGFIVLLIPPNPFNSRATESEPFVPAAGGTIDVGDVEIEPGGVFLHSTPPPQRSSLGEPWILEERVCRLEPGAGMP